MDLGKTISGIRKLKGIQQDTLAAKTNLSVTYISQIENNKKLPNISTLESICSVLKIPLPILFFLSINKEDIPKNKKEAYSVLFPPVEQLIKEFFLNTIK